MIFDAVEHSYTALEDARRSWILAAVDDHVDRCEPYGRLAEARSTAPGLDDAGRLDVPLVPSLLFKRGAVRSPGEGPTRESISSGTRGGRSVVTRDDPTLERFVGSVVHGLETHVGELEDGRAFLLSPPAEDAGDLWFAYVLSLLEVVYEADYYVEGETADFHRLHDDLTGLVATERPVLIGPPHLIRDFAAWSLDRGAGIDLGANGALVMTAGGWKSHEGSKLGRDELQTLIHHAFDVPAESSRDIYNMVELNSVLFECSHQQKHLPLWVEAQARDLRDVRAVLDDGEVGLLAFMDPSASSFPCFVLSDDLGAVEVAPCACGSDAPRVRIERRLESIEARGCALKMERFSPLVRRAR